MVGILTRIHVHNDHRQRARNLKCKLIHIELRVCTQFPPPPFFRIQTSKLCMLLHLLMGLSCLFSRCQINNKIQRTINNNQANCTVQYN